MSVETTVYLDRSQMPSPSEWAIAIRDAGFDVDLDTGFDVDESTGFLPCKHEGIKSGFEFYSDPVPDEDRRNLNLPDECNIATSFVTHSDLRELVAAAICAGVLCVRSGGVLFDTEAGEMYLADSALEWARSLVEECASDL